MNFTCLSRNTLKAKSMVIHALYTKMMNPQHKTDFQESMVKGLSESAWHCKRTHDRLQKATPLPFRTHFFAAKLAFLKSLPVFVTPRPCLWNATHSNSDHPFLMGAESFHVTGDLVQRSTKLSTWNPKAFIQQRVCGQATELGAGLWASITESRFCAERAERRVIIIENE